MPYSTRELKIASKGICRIAHKARQVILEVYAQETPKTALKSDSSPVTEADMRSHEVILKGLGEVFSVPILSEEEPVSFYERKDWASYWLVDPLDGTKDFLARSGDFTINIALVEDSVPILGVVDLPVHDTTYLGFRGGGAHRIDSSGQRQIFVDSRRKELVGTKSRLHRADDVERFFKRHGITNVMSRGSAIKFCLIAEGVVDIYPRFSPTMEWDTAAAHAILNEAGGKIIDVELGRALQYNKENLRNPSFLAARNDLELS